MALRSFPQFRDASEAKEFVAGRPDVVRIFLAGNGFPLVEAACRNQAAPAFERRAERGFFCDRFTSRVRQLVANARVFGPARNQAPLVLVSNASLFTVLANNQNARAGRNVVSGFVIRDHSQVELQRNDVGVGVKSVAAAHSGVLSDSKLATDSANEKVHDVASCCKLMNKFWLCQFPRQQL